MDTQLNLGDFFLLEEAVTNLSAPGHRDTSEQPTSSTGFTPRSERHEPLGETATDKGSKERKLSVNFDVPSWFFISKLILLNRFCCQKIAKNAKNTQKSKETKKILSNLSKEFGGGEIELKEDISKVSLVGVGMKSHAGVAATMFKTLAEKKINIEIKKYMKNWIIERKGEFYTYLIISEKSAKLKIFSRLNIKRDNMKYLFVPI